MADFQNFTKAARAEFLQGLREADQRWKSLIKVVPSDSDFETYDSFSPAPALQEMTDQGFETATGVRFNYSLTNQDWGVGIEIHRSALEDDKLGGFMAQVRQLGIRTRHNTFRQVLQTLWDGDVTASYDGSNFFAATHNDWTGDNAASSVVAGGTAIPSLAELEASYEDNRATFLEFTDSRGEPIWWDHSDLWIACGPRLETVFSRMLANRLRTAGEEQIHQGDSQLLVSPITNDTSTQKEYVLFHASENDQPILWQTRKAPVEETEIVVKGDVARFFVKERFVVGYYRPWSAIKHDFTT